MTVQFDEGDLLPVGMLIDDRYQVEGVLGQGGFAIVYRALHTRLNKQVALKVLDIHGSSRDMKIFRERFEREAQLASRLDMANVVTIYDYGYVPTTNQPYIAMEMLHGHDLEDELKTSGAMTPARCVPLFLPVLQALERGHQRGVVHKDLKPSNLYLCDPNTTDERLVVLDYGIARVFDTPDSKLTATNQFAGTPAYMAPEYIEYQTVSPQVDVYQIGLILIETLTGRAVVEAPSSMGYFVAHCEGRHDVPASLAQTALGQVLLRAIAVDVQDRWPSAAAFAHALSQVPLDIHGAWGVGAQSTGAVPTHEHMPPYHQNTERDQISHGHVSYGQSSHHPSHTAAPMQVPPVSQSTPGKGTQTVILAGVAAAIVVVCAVLGTALVFVARDSVGTGHTSREGSQAGPLSSNHASNAQEMIKKLQATQDSGMDTKLHAVHVGYQMLNPAVDTISHLYSTQIEKFGWSKPTLVASLAPRRMSTNFEHSLMHLRRAQKMQPGLSALDEATSDYIANVKLMRALYEDFHVYYHQDKTYEEDKLAGGKALDKRFHALWPKYSASAKTLRHQMTLVDGARLRSLHDKLAKDQVMVQVLIAYQGVVAMVNGLLDDPDMALADKLKNVKDATRKARSLYQKTPSDTPVYFGPQPLIESLSGLVRQLSDVHRLQKKKQDRAKVLSAVHELRGDYHRAMMALWSYTQRLK